MMRDQTGTLPDPIEKVAGDEQYALFKCGNGTVYALQFKEEKTVVTFADAELVSFLGDYETVKANYPSYSDDQILAQMWDQGGYSWMAVPDETGL